MYTNIPALTQTCVWCWQCTYTRAHASHPYQFSCMPKHVHVFAPKSHRNVACYHPLYHTMRCISFCILGRGHITKHTWHAAPSFAQVMWLFQFLHRFPTQHSHSCCGMEWHGIQNSQAENNESYATLLPSMYYVPITTSFLTL